MGFEIIPQHELIDLVETVSPNITYEHAEKLAEQLRPALLPLDAAFALVSDHPVLREAFGELLNRLSGGMEGIA